MKAGSSIDTLARELRATYLGDSCPYIQNASRSQLPDRDMVHRITDRFFPILYPGIHGPRPDSSRFPFFLAQELSGLREQLLEQIVHALKFKHSDLSSDVYYVWGAEKADAFLETLPAVRKILNEDVKAAFDADPAAKGYFEIVLNYPGVTAVTVYRLAHVLDRLGVPLIPRMMTEYAHSQTGIDIHPAAEIGAAFFIDHGTGTTIGETTIIGRYVTLYQGVTLGAINFDRDGEGALVRGAKRHPTLEDHVIVYANATILGGDTVIGRNSTVGANVWLMKSLKPETVAKLEKREIRIEKKPPAKKARSQLDVDIQSALERLADDGCPNCNDL